MAEFYYPNYQETLDNLHSIPQGFFIEIYEDYPPVLYLKFDAGIILPIIKGCDLQINIIKEEQGYVTISLLIYDHPNRPLIIRNTQMFSVCTSNDLPQNKIENIFNQGLVKITLFNEEARPIYSFSIKNTCKKNTLIDWFNNNTNLEAGEKNYKINLKNRNHTNDKKFISIINYEYGNNVKHLSSQAYNIDEFLNKQSGTHGYSLEKSIEKILSLYFKIDSQLFISPLNENNEEYCDFVLILQNSIILFESKFVLSNKSSKINAALKEGVKQIITSEQAIKEKKLNLKNKILENELLSNKWLLKVLLYNDSINLTDSRCSSIFSDIDKFQLPMFMSVTTLNQLLAALHIKNRTNFITNLDTNLWQFFYDYYSCENHKFLIFENYDII